MWAIAVFAGIVFLTSGAVELGLAAAIPERRWLHVLFGLLGVAAGVVAFVWPGATFVVLAAIVAWYLLFHGILEVVVALTIPDLPMRWWVFALGIAEILVGFWAISQTERSLLLLAVWVAVVALARGISDIFWAFALKDLQEEFEQAGRGFSGPAVA